MGQLTFAGQMQALELGKWLRERYVNQLGLLPPSYQVWCSYQGWRGKGGRRWCIVVKCLLGSVGGVRPKKKKHQQLNTSSSGRPVGCMSTLLKQHLNTHTQATIKKKYDQPVLMCQLCVVGQNCAH
jgi:hypothetical protein